MTRLIRLMVAVSVVGALCAGALAGIAAAVSAGGFNSAQQDCTLNAAAEATPPGFVEPGCHALALNIEDGAGTRYGEFGFNEMPDGGPAGTPGLLSLGYPGNDNSPHAGCFAFNLSGTGGGPGVGCGNNPNGAGASGTFDYYVVSCALLGLLDQPCQSSVGPYGVTPDEGVPDPSELIENWVTNGMLVYFGAFDNLDAGEHDGVDGSSDQTCTATTCTNPSTSAACSGANCNPNETAGSINGPSDGGASFLAVDPQDAGVMPSLENLFPLISGALGACVDGNCLEASSVQQTVYQGCSPADDQASDVACSPGQAGSSRNAADYSSKTWDPFNCSSGDPVSESPGPDGCGTSGMDPYRQSEVHNVSVEPGVTLYEDPDPQASPIALYPLPALYIGSCGVIVGGGMLPALPAGPLTNAAGQLDLSTGC